MYSRGDVMKFRYDLQEPLFRACNIDIQSVSRPKNYRHSFRNGREKHGFIYVVSGKMLDSFQNYGKIDLCAGAGDLIFVPKGSIYTGIYSEDNTKIKIVQFELISGDLPDYLSAPVKIDLPCACELIDAFFQPTENHTSYHPFYYLSCLYGLLWRIDETCAKIPPKYKKLQPALSEVGERPYENQTVSYYAELCGMSEANFRRLFREYTGMSPIEYRNDIRLTHAKNKLQSGEYNVSETAYETGFTNLSFFIRLYKKKYGYTPKKE